jgi:hypothetical protein
METKKYSTFFSIVEDVHKEKNLPDFSKLIFYDIAYLCIFKGGKCYAANNHFAQKYNKSEGTVSKAISSLFDNGYIERFVDQNKNRKIYIKFDKFKKNGSDSFPDSLLMENKDWRDTSSQEEMNLMKDNTSQGYSPNTKDKPQKVLSSKIIKCVAEQFKMKDPINTMLDLLPRLLDQNKNFNIKDIEKTLINLINRRNVDKIKENISSYFETHLGLSIVSYKRSESGQILVDSLKTTYIPSLAEYLILHLYNLAKEISRESPNLPPSEDQGIYSFATDTYEIIWHKLSEGERATVKGKLTNINVIKGKNPNMPFAYLKLMNPENQELIIQVGSKNYQRSMQSIHLGKGEDVAIHGPVQYSKRNDQNIVILFEIEVNTPQVSEEDELNGEV